MLKDNIDALRSELQNSAHLFLTNDYENAMASLHRLSQYLKMIKTGADYSNLTQNKNWIITEDHGICNDCPNATKEQLMQIVFDEYTDAFRMYDDDGELYYSGWAKSDAEFDPLDDFGTPNAGCTSISYYNHTKLTWEQL